ncbi:hypothetical protein GPECTOR_7g992 [Gonium pectorale]|uniref:Uncharacterized protein n=1 Tax=Gonium pectorale TaxID=33097 RepID=A0A150GV17_GONPE|nr:hypothetical protein GPECTOR_7g992 [Gonium pectorale]|eukprot:KXZ53542.1 hypothetical protein GPECTOR_7g992 [Gonium pectorale]
MLPQQLSSPPKPPHSPSGWKARSPRPACGSPGSFCGSPVRLAPTNAIAGVGVQVPATSASPASPSFNRSGSASGRSGSPSPSARPINAAHQILVRAAAEARVTASAPADLSEVSSRLASTQSWPALQVLALQYRGRLDAAGLVAVLRKAAQLAAATPNPTASDQYACSRLLECLALTAAPLLPAMGAPTQAAVLGTLGALASSGLVAGRQVPNLVVVLVQALTLASMPQLGSLTGPQLAAVLRGSAALCPAGLPEVWLDEWQAAATGRALEDMPAEALEAVLTSVETLYARQNWLPADSWLGELLSALESKMPAFEGSSLRRLATTLAGLEVRPAAPWLGAFRAAFDERVAAAEMEPADVAGVLFAFTKLEVAFA